MGAHRIRSSFASRLAELFLSNDFDWTPLGLCNKYSDARRDQLFFPSLPTGNEHTAEAKAICAECPVRLQCLERAMALEGSNVPTLRYSIYGGTTGSDRYKLYEKRALPAEPEKPKIVRGSNMKPCVHCGEDFNVYRSKEGKRQTYRRRLCDKPECQAAVGQIRRA